MRDIVERLREKSEWTNQRPYFHAHDKCLEAAAEITRLRAELSEARGKALEEAAKVAKGMRAHSTGIEGYVWNGAIERMAREIRDLAGQYDIATGDGKEGV